LSESEFPEFSEFAELYLWQLVSAALSALSVFFPQPRPNSFAPLRFFALPKNSAALCALCGSKSQPHPQKSFANLCAFAFYSRNPKNLHSPREIH
jgi:hypothetical protein